MSFIIFNHGSAPSTPVADKSAIYVDSADKRLKQIDDDGVVSILTPCSLERNFLANGGFDVNQRLATALTNIPSPSATARVYTADRWGFTVGNTTTPQYQWVDTIAAPETNITARYYARYKQLTNAAKVMVTQVISASDIAPLRGRVVRFQCKMKYSVGANRDMRLGLIQLNSSGTADTPPATFVSAFNSNGTDPTLGTNLAYITPTLVDGGTLVSSAMTAPITTTWTRFSATFTVPTTCVNLVVAVWSNNTFAANDDLLITECGLYEGREIIDWVSMPRNVEMLRCQRYFCKTFAAATPPATSVGINTGEAKGIAGKAGAVANSGIIPWRYPVTMFKTPAVTLYNPAAGNALIRNLTGAADMGATTNTLNLDASTIVIATGVAATAVGDQIGIHISADAEI